MSLYKSTYSNNNTAYQLDAKIIANPLYDRIIDATHTRYLNKRPKLIALLSDSCDASSYKYAEMTQKNCIKNGIDFQIQILPILSVESYIKWANNDSEIDGIIVYYPIFGEIEHDKSESMDNYLKDLINHKKDVEGLSHYYRFNLYHDIKSNIYFTPLHNIAPCTALAIIKCLEYLGQYCNNNLPHNKLCDKIVTIINRSDIVGKPTALLLANDGADVYSVDKNSIFLMRKEATGKIYSTEKTSEQACAISDIIILGVPDPNYKLATKYIKENTIVINVSSYKNIDETELMKINGIKYISSIGKITIAMLQYNLLSLCDCFRN
jgi:methylenetetrahydrofolate dehydrogenase (NAD+)